MFFFKKQLAYSLQDSHEIVEFAKFNVKTNDIPNSVQDKVSGVPSLILFHPSVNQAVQETTLYDSFRSFDDVKKWLLSQIIIQVNVTPSILPDEQDL